jgi:hypothetical protein
MKLDNFLSYDNLYVKKRYTVDYPNNTLQADQAFTELLKFFWLCKQHKTEQAAEPDNEALHFSCSIHMEMSEIDDMWHTFLLFTKDYMQFSETYFGGFVHHQPNIDEDTAENGGFNETELARYFTYIEKKLGEETLAKWFSL